MKPRVNASLVATLILLLLLGGGCGDGKSRIETPPVPSDPTRTWVERLSISVDDSLRQHAEARATGGEITALLNREARRGWYDRIAGGIKYADLFQELYTARENHKAFARSDGLSPRGERVLEVLNASADHALDPAPYHVARITTLSAELARAARQDPEWQEIRLQPAEAERLIAWMKERKLDPHAPETRRKVLDALLGVEQVRVELPEVDEDAASDDAKTDEAKADDEPEERWEEVQLEEPPAPRIVEAAGSYEDTFKRSAKMTAELELRVSDGALRYARDMKHFNLARLDWRDIKAVGGSKNLIYGRLADTFDDITTSDQAGVAEVFAGLRPAHPQYGKLVKALARYRAIAAEGGWEKVRRFDFEPGARHRRVPQLRERLAREGFLEVATLENEGAGPAPAADGELNNATGAAEMGAPGGANEAGAAEAEESDDDRDELVDDALVSAIKSYQESHQFRPNGESSGGFWRSINVPIERRTTQLELALQRWRETQYRGEKDFIHVNIPDFHAEVWFANERTMRFRVVTGNNKRQCNRKTKKWELPNATPVQVAELDHMIFNPYWNVPKRIVDEEIRPEMKKSSTYLEKNHYEFVDTRSGREWVRQTPGDHNALGRVKFIFPNPHNTYMHDTPSKKYFNYPVRAFSHGCVRVQDPLDLAVHLLEQNDEGDRAWMDGVLESGKTRKVEFERKIPVFFEYVTVRVDDQGRANFLADIYRKDKRRLSEDPEEFDSCSVRRTPRPDEDASDDGDETPPDEADVGP